MNVLRAVSVLSLLASVATAQLAYPDTRRVDHTDVYHGVEVADPYRWLENDIRGDDEVAAWVDAQNKVTRAYLGDIAARGAIVERLTTLWNHERFGVPRKKGGRWVFTRNDGLQQHAVTYAMSEGDGEPRVLVDPNTWSQDGSAALGGTSFSDDGRWMAYALQESGSDWRTWRIRDLTTGEDLPETLTRVKFSFPAWTADSKGFFYGRFDEVDEEQRFQQLTLGHRVYYHRVGSDPADDVLVYERPDRPEWNFAPGVTDDGRWLVLTVWKGGHTNTVLVKDLEEPFGLPVPLVDGWDARYTFIDNDGSTFYLQTDLDAPNGRVVAVDARHPDREGWVTAVSEADQALRGVDVVGNMFACRYLKDASSQVRLLSMRGELVREVELPGLGTVAGFGGKRTDTETFYSFESFTTPPRIYRYDLLTGATELFQQAQVDFDPEVFTVERVFYASKDGTRVPLFLAYRKGLERDGDNPTLLYGYGGFNIAMRPRFSVTRLQWMEMGGVFAMACLRGGGEYGKSWHRSGTKLQKQNVFDDFIAAAEWLVENDYTRPEKLAIHGRSNGGLLVGAVTAQRPDLFGAALPEVGVMDMLRYHEFTAGRFWTDDYGSSDDPEELAALLAYSPYHNLVQGTAYPPTLVTTADTDDRVVPGHSFKYAAELQHAHAGDAPTLISISGAAGHGSGKPTSQRIEEAADLWAFLVQNLGMDGPGGEDG